MAAQEALTINTGSQSKGEDSQQTGIGPFEIQVSLTGMNSDDALSVVLPPKYAEIPVSDLLERFFPEAGEDRREVASMFDLRANPDLPDIYAVFMDAFDEWRKGRCTLSFSGSDGEKVDAAGPVSQHLNPGQAPSASGSSYPVLDLRVEQRYRAIEYGVRQGFWESKEELLEWLRWLTLLYFLDKHEVELPASSLIDDDGEVLPSTIVLQSKDLISLSEETQTFAITEEGRRFIDRLLGETESYIDLYDHFKDTEFELVKDAVEFGGGRGIDLRVQVFVAEGLDPIRTVFLLRLYDGTLDPFASTWKHRIDDEKFFDEVLEPVVNRHEVDEALIAWIIESGYAHLDEREEHARKLESQEDVIRRVWP